MSIVIVKVLSDKKEDLLAAMEVFERNGFLFGCYFMRDNGQGMVMGKDKPFGEPGVNSMPYKMKAQQATDFIMGWLESEAKYEPKPSGDSTFKKGFIIQTCDVPFPGSFASIDTAWRVYGK